MRIFLSYASERRQIAELLSLALVAEGHEVFFDRSSLPQGQAYDGKIRRAIEECNLFIFMISPESVEPGSYTLSELAFMRKRAPAPGDQVLPVTVASVPIESVPTYLRALTIMEPVGNLTADVLAKVSEICAVRRKVWSKRFLRVGAALIIIGGVAGGFSYWRPWLDSVQLAPAQVTLQRGLSIFRDPDQNSEIVYPVKAGEAVTLMPPGKNPNWVPIRTTMAKGWAMVQDIVPQNADKRDAIKLGEGYGFQGSFWKLFFTSPQPEGKAPNRYGIDVRFADAIARVHSSLDMAVYELNNRSITDAIIEAHSRGVKVRVVTDARSKVTQGQTFSDLMAAGIPVVASANNNHLMHNKFAILDAKTVWTGSWNYTDEAYVNNENAIALEATDIAARYRAVFNEMFEEKRFGGARKKASNTGAPPPVLNHGVQILFSPEDPILPYLGDHIRVAKRSVAVLAFSFTSSELAEALISAARMGVVVRGLFEKSVAKGSDVVGSLCTSESGVQLRLDSNPRFLHHNVFVIDDEIVITGSPNFSRQALTRNDENAVVIPDATLAKRYLAEFSRLWATGTRPDPGFCSEPPK
jgi:HKD family nuclease